MRGRRYFGHMWSIRWGAVLLALGSIAAAAYLFTLDRTGMVRLVADLSGYDKLDKISGQLTTTRVALVRIIPLAAAMLFAFIAWRPTLITTPSRNIGDAVRYAWAWVRNTWSSMGLWERVVFIGMLAIGTTARSFLAATEPAHVDEAMTWLLFTSRGPLVAATFYAAPNNHILHSLLTTFTNWLPLDPLLAMRVPVVLAALLAQAALHLLLRKITGAYASLAATFLVIGSFPIIYYGYSSRGYMMVVLAFIVAYAATRAVVRTGDRRAMLVLCMACVTGLFTMPSFLYPTVLLFLFALVRRPSQPSKGYLIDLLRTGMLTAVLTAILYLPAIMMSGLGAFTHNQWVAPISRTEVLARWWPHFASTFDWLTGTTFGSLLVLFITLAPLLLLRGSDRTDARLNAVLIGGSLIIPILHSVIPFERTWIHLIVPLAVSTALLLQALTRSMGKRALLLIPISALLLLVSAARFMRIVPQQEYMAYSARAMFAEVQNVEPKDVYCEFVVMGDHLVFDLKSRGMPYTYTLSPEGRDREAVLAANRYTMLIVRSSAPILDPFYREVFNDGTQRAYVQAAR